MSDDLVQRLRDASLVIQYPERSKIANRIKALEAENQKLHGWVQSAEQAAGTLQRKANAYESRIEALEAELAVCREAIEVCLDVAEDLPADDDGDASVRRCTLRRLNEAIGKAVPRLIRERPEGQKMYGLRYREMRERIKALEVTLERQQMSYDKEREIDQEEIERLIALRRDDASVLARMRALIADAEVLAEYGRDDGLRDRADVGAWLSPGDRIVVLRDEE